MGEGIGDEDGKGNGDKVQLLSNRKDFSVTGSGWHGEHTNRGDDKGEKTR